MSDTSSSTLLLYTPPLPRYATIDASVGYHGNDAAYRISDHGVIQSFRRGGEWRVRSPSTDKHGYKMVTISWRVQGILYRKIVYPHILVCRYFVRAPEPGEEVGHNDGNRLNNHWTNLHPIDHPGNMYTALLQGTLKTTLDWDRVRAIRSRGNYRDFLGGGIALLAKENGVSENTIRRVLQHDTWVDLSSSPYYSDEGSAYNALEEQWQEDGGQGNREGFAQVHEAHQAHE